MISTPAHRLFFFLAGGFACGPVSLGYAQHRWEQVSASPGASAIIGEQQDTLLHGQPWDTDNQDNCGTGGAADTRCEWITEHAGDDIHQRRNGVLAALLDGVTANQSVVVQDRDDWYDHLSNGSTWLVNYNAYFLAVNPADMANLRVIMELQHSGVTRLTLNLSGLSASGHFLFRMAPLHTWFDSPETGDWWKIKITLRRLTAGVPALIWIDDIDVVEAGTVHYHEEFPILGDANNDGSIALDDYTAFVGCFDGEGNDYTVIACHDDDWDDDGDVDMLDFVQFQILFSGPL